VGIVAPASPVDPGFLQIGTARIQSNGFRTLTGRHVEQRLAYLAGTDRQRCEDLNSMLNNPAVRAVLFARGGYGVMRLLDEVDRGAVESDPKILLGMSDITALQLSLFKHCGLTTFAGPMVAGQLGEGLDSLSEEWLLRALTEPVAGRNLIPIEDCGIRVIRHGRASGIFLGGCLSLVTSLLGSSHCPDFNDAVLLLEDVHEPPYRIDRMLTQLRLAGVLNKAAAIVLGHFVGPDGTDPSEETERIVTELTEYRPVPVISRYPHGHKVPNLTLPIGVPVELNTEPLSMRVAIG